MKLLQCTREEAEDIFKTDDLIDHNQHSPYDLSREAELEANLISATTRKKVKKENDMRGKARPKNQTKIELIKHLFQALQNFEIVTNLNVENEQRKITFSCENQNFDLNLVQKHKKKE